ncbi:response regulator [Streptomyces sp. NPDC018031]|uniref:response regulator n=1 Tax=Streptomyces sp. NPDC018031 TaxID=3365033 RepID=UPI0037A7E004
MGELRPLADGLAPECREFAAALRELFTGLDVSVRRYAARRYRDAGTISRYLSGTRVPPWEFVFDLLTDLAEVRGSAVTPGTIELVRELHRAAVRTGSSAGHAVEVLQHQLADADREARTSSATEDVLGEALLDRRHRIADLEVRLSQLEADRAADRARAETLEQAFPDLAGLLRERDALQREVRRLAGELEEVRRRGMLAEDRCHLLERQLAAVEAQAAAARTPSAEVPPPARPGPPTEDEALAAPGPAPGDETLSQPGLPPGDEAALAQPGPMPADEAALARPGGITGYEAALARPGATSADEPVPARPGPPLPPADSPVPVPAGRPPKILLVDDQEDNLLALRAVLATLGQDIVSATSGREALKALLDHDDFAVILLDVQMPEMDGYETAAQIKRRRRNRDIPILFLTAMGTDPEHSSRGYAAGGADYISKPIDPWALRAKVSIFTEICLERRHYARHLGHPPEPPAPAPDGPVPYPPHPRPAAGPPAPSGPSPAHG